MSDDLQEIRARLDAMSNRVRVVEEQNEWLEQELEKRDERIAELEEEMAEYERRSELLDRVIQSGNSTRQERAALLLQVLYNDAVSSNGSASMDARAGWDNLNRTIDRTTVYDIFETAVEAVGDEEVCYIKKENRSASKNTRLILEPDAGPVPDVVAGITLKGGAD